MFGQTGAPDKAPHMCKLLPKNQWSIELDLFREIQFWYFGWFWDSEIKKSPHLITYLMSAITNRCIIFAILLVFFCKFLLIQLACTLWRGHGEDWGLNPPWPPIGFLQNRWEMCKALDSCQNAPKSTDLNVKFLRFSGTKAPSPDPISRQGV